MGAGDSIDIEVGDLHRIENIGSVEVIFVEVQTGTYFGEDDIERIEDDFGR
jgi:mannose-6-phosphate isomerase